jgi:hypothetical protein
MGGGSVGPTGQFNFSVEEAYLIENGKLQNRSRSHPDWRSQGNHEQDFYVF